MHFNGQGRSRDFVFAMIGMTASCGTLSAADAPGGATIGIPVPVATAPASPVDPFLQGGAIPTPFVPYASQGTDLDTATPSVNMAAPLPSATVKQPVVTSPPTPQPIGAGDLVPITIPSATKAASPAKPAVSAAGEMTQIRPASTSRPAPATTASKEKKPKKASAAMPTTTSPPPDESEVVRPPVRFSFPQPVIPLDSALRRWFGFSASRR